MEIKNLTNNEEIANIIASSINKKLKEGERVLWFVCGGSSMEMESIVSNKLENFNVDNLTITLTDERWGDVGQINSNWQGLKNLGFNFENKKLIPFLVGKSIDETKEYLEKELSEAMSYSDYKIGIFGMGSDGHIAGILPQSPAVSSDKQVCYYDGGTFERLTTTFNVLEKLDEAFIYVFGKNKWEMIENLDKEISLSLMPAQIMKKVKSLTIFTDYNGNESR